MKQAGSGLLVQIATPPKKVAPVAKPAAESMMHFIGKHALKAVTTFGPLVGAIYLGKTQTKLLYSYHDINSSQGDYQGGDWSVTKGNGYVVASAILYLLSGGMFVYNYVM